MSVRVKDPKLLPFFRVEEIDDAMWVLAFFHNSSGGTYWNRRDGSILYSLEKKRFSILNALDDSFKYEGKYEFLIRYPGYEGFNRWRQDLNPIYDNESNHEYKNMSIGYTPVNISWNKEKGFEHFGGLAVSSSDKTLVDGFIDSSFNQFYYAIGLYEEWYGGIPGFKLYYPLESVELWIRVKSVQYCQKSEQLISINHHIILVFLVNCINFFYFVRSALIF